MTERMMTHQIGDMLDWHLNNNNNVTNIVFKIALENVLCHKTPCLFYPICATNIPDVLHVLNTELFDTRPGRLRGIASYMYLNIFAYILKFKKKNPPSRPKRIPRSYPSVENTPFSRILDEKKPAPFSTEIADFEAQ